jgi:uncharacterized protein (DUF302 family)
MSEVQENNQSRKSDRNTWIGLAAGFAAGALVCGIVMFTVMPSLMIVTEESSLGFDETVAALEKSIEKNGWAVSRVANMNNAMAKHGVEFEPRVTLVKLCKAEYAKSVLSTDRQVSTMMPCTVSVWEGDDGKVYLSKMNMSLMAKMFGGNVARVMGRDVVRDEQKILEGIRKEG